MIDWEGLLASGVRVAGVDEAGRGPLAGDVFAAAVILAPERSITGLRDSKKLGAARREALAETVCTSALAWSVARASVAEIDTLNILQASLLAMHRAVQGLSATPEVVLVDGNRLPDWPWHSAALVGGDDLVPAISAASVLAKVARDEEMRRLHACYPDYGFASHKGYPTAAHLAALQRFGPSPIHRLSFAPVRAAAAQYAGESR
ncbi:MAG: ribonuclease HII [Pseudomonadales bacterium]|nr:ribonuclease HII [Pseudomonadales bacterium]